MILLERIISNINRLLGERQKSQVWLAKEIGMPQSQLNRYLTGRRPIPMEVAEKAAKAFPVPFEELLEVPLAKGAAPREPTELELLFAIVDRWHLHPERKELVLGLLRGSYLDGNKASAIRAVLEATNAEMAGITAAVIPVLKRLDVGKDNQGRG